ncbi:hypothetical protein [Ferribacterium limneticum]|nr:hypothetical protein [Ferribacterium limneticum]UCV21665.1 hypothetical protein KI613_14085 [Ferribacterium limneticum]
MPERGPDASQRMSLAIFINAVASAWISSLGMRLVEMAICSGERFV